jgi:hypothetical protein
MRFVILLALLALMGGCAPNVEHPTTMAHTAWIQKGITTRSQIEARFGSPNFEVPEYAGSTPETALTSTPRDDVHAPATSTVIQSPKDTKATYVPRLSAAETGPTNQDRLWVIYDENNVVKDFGFARPPASIPPHQ